MNERDDKQLGELKRDKTSFLSRWSERKKQSALVQNTADTNDNTSEHLSAESKYTEQVDDSEETLTDTELLQKYSTVPITPTKPVDLGKGPLNTKPQLKQFNS